MSSLAVVGSARRVVDLEVLTRSSSPYHRPWWFDISTFDHVQKEALISCVVVKFVAKDNESLRAMLRRSRHLYASRTPLLNLLIQLSAEELLPCRMWLRFEIVKEQKLKRRIADNGSFACRSHAWLMQPRQ